MMDGSLRGGHPSKAFLPGRTSDDQVTVFKSVGNAVQDVSVGARVLEEVKKKNLGTIVEL